MSFELSRFDCSINELSIQFVIVLYTFEMLFTYCPNVIQIYFKLERDNKLIKKKQITRHVNPKTNSKKQGIPQGTHSKLEAQSRSSTVNTTNLPTLVLRRDGS